jgi:hypothetical protein
MVVIVGVLCALLFGFLPIERCAFCQRMSHWVPISGCRLCGDGWLTTFEILALDDDGLVTLEESKVP